MIDSPLLSVIVPIYKTENYLNQCIESIVTQTYENLEIILVDDGSPDNCPAMCDAWAEKDKRIKVVHQENAGGGAARNTGYAIAKGSFVAFIDSDDYLSPVMFEHLISLCDDNTDIAECEIIMTKNDDAFFSGVSSAKILKADTICALRYHIANSYFQQTPPNKIYRKTAVANNLFPIGRHIDDEFWTYKVIGNSRNLVHSSAKLYAYRQQSDSVTHQKYSLKYLHAIEAKKERADYIHIHFPELENDAIASLFFSCIYHGQLALLELKKEERKSAFSILHPIIKNVHLPFTYVKTFSMQKRFWYYLSKINFPFCCAVKNLLKVGL